MSRFTFAILATVLGGACAENPTIPAEHAAASLAVISSGGSYSVVMSGLNSPRGLAFGPEGALYVTEAGTTTVNGPCFQFMEGAALNTKCYSGTGSVSRLWKGNQQRIVSGLPSNVIIQNGFASGPSDISFQGRGNAYIPLGWGSPPAARSLMGAGGLQMGSLIKLEPSGQWQITADVSAFEATHNPAGGPIDSNPYGVLAEAGKVFVADAGGNSLLEVSSNGDVSLVATFPPTPSIPPFNSSEAVPTKIVRGPDGALYVSTLSGVPFQAGNAKVYRVVPGQAPQVHADGFKTITDLDFGPDGSLYVVQFATDFLFFGGPGALIRVAPNGARTTLTTNLFQPTGVAVGPDGAIYVSNNGTLTGTGEVVRITQ